METFICLEFIQMNTSIQINLDYYIEAVLDKYQKFSACIFHSKQTPAQSMQFTLLPGDAVAFHQNKRAAQLLT